MKNPITEKQIQEILHQTKVSPSKQWEQMMLNKLVDLQAQERVDQVGERDGFFQNLFVNSHLMFKKSLAAGFLAVLLVFGGALYLKQSPLEVARGHIANASALLEELKGYVATGEVASAGEGVFLVAFADDAGEGQVADIVAEIEVETESALDAVEGADDLAGQAEVLNEIDDLQDETVEVLGDVLETVEGEEVAGEIADSIEATVTQNIEVEQVASNVESAVATGETVVVNVESKKKDGEKKAEQQKAKLEFAAGVLAGVDVSGDDVSESVKKKYEKVQAILAACEAGEDKCNAGKAKGLAVAIEAKLKKHEEKKDKEEKKLKREDDKDGDDDGDDDSDDDDDDKKEEKSEKSEKPEKSEKSEDHVWVDGVKVEVEDDEDVEDVEDDEDVEDVEDVEDDEDVELKKEKDSNKGSDDEEDDEEDDEDDGEDD